jgi:hypothetical protein
MQRIHFYPNALHIESVHMDEIWAPRTLDFANRFYGRYACITDDKSPMHSTMGGPVRMCRFVVSGSHQPA